MPNFKTFLFCCGFFFCTINSTNATTSTWNGYDYDNKTEIEISSGNLVREGSMIQFYDSKADNYHTGRVLFVDSVAVGTRIQVLDLDLKKERTLTMRDE